jgi:hypothetical protein
MNDALLWMLWIFIFVLLSGYLFFGLTQFKAIKKTPYQFHHHLPFELHETPFASMYTFQPLKGLFIFFLVCLFAYWESMFVYPNLPITYVLLALMIIFLISTMGIFTLEPRKIEMYIWMVTLYGVSIVAILFLGSYVTFTSPYPQFQTFLPWTTLAQGIFQLSLLMNPRLKDWALLEKVESTNEKPLYRRPTFFVMAYTQWLSLANVMLWVLLTQIEWLIG